MLQAAFFGHALASIVYGRFGRARTVTWIALVFVFNVIGALGEFVGYVLPWGQMRYWFATIVVNAASALPGGDWLVARLFGGDSDASPAIGWPSGALVMGAVSLTIFGIDALAMYAGMWRTRSVAWVIGRVLLIVIVVVFALVLTAIVIAQPAAPPDDASVLVTPARIVPEWWFRPLYAILRGSPDKLFGVLLMVAALLIPVVMPLVRAWRFNADWRRWLWWPLCASLAASWITLGWLGGRAPDDAVIVWSRLLTAYYFAFFLIISPALGLARR